ALFTRDHVRAKQAACTLPSSPPPAQLGSMASEVTIVAAVAAGTLSFLSPCVLPLVPPYLIYLAGTSLERLADAESEPLVTRVPDGASLRIRLDAVHRADPRRHPGGGGIRGDGRRGRGPACALLAGARRSVRRRGVCDRAVRSFPCPLSRASRQGGAGDGRAP